MACVHFKPIGDDGYGFCTAHERHVSAPRYAATMPVSAYRCLCDFCKPGADGKPAIDPDVFFYRNDLIGLLSVERDVHDKMVAEAAAMKCAVPAPRPDPVPKPVARAIKKPRPRLF